MKNLIFVFFVFIALSISANNKTGKLEIGDRAVLTDIKMLDVSDKMISIESVKKDNGVLVLFSCNQCPFVLRWEDRFNDLKKWADKNDVGMLVLNSNYKNREGVDSFEAMKSKSKEMGYNFNYVVDKDSKVANAFGGQTTPHAFLFDGNYILVYKGAIDDNYKSADEVSETYLKDAIAKISSGEDVVIAETKPVGCSIKRKLD